MRFGSCSEGMGDLWGAVSRRAWDPGKGRGELGAAAARGAPGRAAAERATLLACPALCCPAPPAHGNSGPMRSADTLDHSAQVSLQSIISTAICSCPHSHSPANLTCSHLFIESSAGHDLSGSGSVCCCSLARVSSVPHLVSHLLSCGTGPFPAGRSSGEYSLSPR